MARVPPVFSGDVLLRLAAPPGRPELSLGQPGQPFVNPPQAAARRICLTPLNGCVRLKPVPLPIAVLVRRLMPLGLQALRQVASRSLLVVRCGNNVQMRERGPGRLTAT
jgi:hypothetical protein